MQDCSGRPPQKSVFGEESPDSTGQEVLLTEDICTKSAGKESATESIPPERSGKGETAV